MNTDVATLLSTAENMTAMMQDHFWLIIGGSIVASLPPFLVLYSKRVRGSQKFLWFLLTSIFSWLAYLPFLFIFRNGRADR